MYLICETVKKCNLSDSLGYVYGKQVMFVKQTYVHEPKYYIFIHFSPCTQIQ